jgi:hypothetical protein
MWDLVLFVSKRPLEFFVFIEDENGQKYYSHIFQKGHFSVVGVTNDPRENPQSNPANGRPGS